MKKFSEYVSLGHPDKIADYISQYILDRYIEKDPKTRYAVEVQIKNNHVTLGGEVSSKQNFSHFDLERFVKEAVNEIGYTKDYWELWGGENTICGDFLGTSIHICQQSPEIAQGLDGWGDQGIFFGYACPDIDTEYMPRDHSIAKRLCRNLYASGLGGLDIKTQIIMENDTIEKVIVAIPLLRDEEQKAVESFVRASLHGDYRLIVNGTGKYTQHSSIADCGMTGRKLAVDFYGGNCRLGGGSPWTKDGSKADLTLNLYARDLAKKYCRGMGREIYTSIACCIGKQEVDICVTDGYGNVLANEERKVSPAELIERYQLNKPIYASMCRWGLFGEYQTCRVWEQ